MNSEYDPFNTLDCYLKAILLPCILYGTPPPDLSNIGILMKDGSYLIEQKILQFKLDKINGFVLSYSMYNKS